MSDRTLTDADVEAIAKQVKNLLVADFYKDLGKGIWALALRAVLLGLIILAAIGGGVLKLPTFLTPHQ